MEDQKNPTKCKGCNFVIRSDKLLVHLNHPSVKCKEAFSKEEYSLVYDLWMESKLGITPLEQNRIKCSGCDNEIDKYYLLFHLNDKKSECKSAYSNDEYKLVFDFWMTHKEKGYKKSLADLPCNVLIKCHGCEHTSLSGEMRKHLDDSKQCKDTYTSNEKTSLRTLESKLTKVKEEEEYKARLKQQAKHYCKNLHGDQLNDDVIGESKTIFIAYSAIAHFVKMSHIDRMGQLNCGYRELIDTVAVLLGYVDDYGYHSTELIYLPKQGSYNYINEIPSKSKEAIKKSETFKKYKTTARVLVWMKACIGKRETIDMSKTIPFYGKDAHTLLNWKNLCRDTISLKANIASNDPLDIGHYAFYDLSDTGKCLLTVCNRNSKFDPKFCKHKDSFKECFSPTNIVVSHSMVTDITYMNDIAYREKQKIKTPPMLFDPSYFAKPEEETCQPKDVSEPAESSSEHESVEDNEDIKKEENDNTTIEVCKFCQKTLSVTTIMKHIVSKEECKQNYSEIDLKELRARINQYRNARRRQRRNKKTNSSKESSIKDFIQCKVCKTKCQLNTIKKHFVQNPKCCEGHSKEELKRIDLKCQKFQKAKKAAQKRARYHKSKEQNTKGEVNLTDVIFDRLVLIITILFSVWNGKV